MLTYQVVAIGDIHLQSTHPRNGARLAALDQIVSEGLALPSLAAWAMLGDLFHGRSTTDDRNQLAARLQRMADAAPVVIVAGNHEQPGDLEIFAELKATWPITVCDVPESFRLQCAAPIDLTVAVLPYPHKANLIAGGITADQTLQAGGQALEDIVRGLATISQANFPLFLAHVNLAGSICSNGQPNIGRELELPPSLLDLFGQRVPKILGHIHRAQQVGLAHYVGSVCRLDFNELEEKRYLVIEYSDDPGLFPLIQSRPIDVAPMFLVEGRLTREGFTLAEGRDPEVERRYHAGDWAGCEVRLRYSFPVSERAVLEDAAVRMVGVFASAARLRVEPVAVPDRALRAPEVAAAVTLLDKVRAWANLTGAAMTDGVLAKLAALEHADPTQVLSDVTNQVAAIEKPAREECAA